MLMQNLRKHSKSFREISKTLNIPYSDVVEAFRAALKTYDNSRKNIRIEEQLNNNTGKTAISLLAIHT